MHLQILYNLFGWHHCLFQNTRGAYSKTEGCVWETAARLWLKPSKCEFFKSWIAYLGHIVSKDGIETDPKKVTAIKEWPVPKTENRGTKFFYHLLATITSSYQSMPMTH